MKTFFSNNRRTLTLIGVLVPLLGMFIYVALRSGPLAPVQVTLTTVASQAITPIPVRYRHCRGALHPQDRPNLRRTPQAGGGAAR